MCLEFDKLPLLDNLEGTILCATVFSCDSNSLPYSAEFERSLQAQNTGSDAAI